MTITIGLGAALGILGIHSIMDIRRKEINVILAGASCLAAGVAWQFFGQKTETAEILLSCLPGSVLLGTAYLTEQKIGYGDGWVVMAAGGMDGSVGYRSDPDRRNADMCRVQRSPSDPEKGSERRFASVYSVSFAGMYREDDCLKKNQR